MTKTSKIVLLLIVFLISCKSDEDTDPTERLANSPSDFVGTWQLYSQTVIQNNDPDNPITYIIGQEEIYDWSSTFYCSSSGYSTYDTQITKAINYSYLTYSENGAYNYILENYKKRPDTTQAACDEPLPYIEETTTQIGSGSWQFDDNTGTVSVQYQWDDSGMMQNEEGSFQVYILGNDLILKEVGDTYIAEALLKPKI